MDLNIQDNNGPLLHFVTFITNSISRLFYGLKISGIENLETDQPVIFIANHASNFDPIWIFGAIPWKIRKKTFAIGKAELMETPLLPFFLKRLNMVAVERSGNIMIAVDTAMSLLNNGKNILIFPEGTRTRTGKMGDFKTGAAQLMLETDAVIIPIKVKGSFDIYPPGKLPKILGGRMSNASVQFGKPITLNDFPFKFDPDSTVPPEYHRISKHFKKVISEM